MRLLLIGAGGFVGSALVGAAETNHEVFVSSFRTPVGGGRSVGHLDITNPAQVRKAVSDSAPDAVILTAGMTDVDRCEDEPELARDVNVLGPAEVAKACEASHSRLVHLSTDYVFDGAKRGRYTESDAPNPLSAYGQTKLEGEVEVARLCSNHAIVRSSVVYGWIRPSTGGQTANGVTRFVPWLIEQIRGGKPVKVFRDQSCTPTFVHDLAYGLILVAASKHVGVLNMAGSDCVTRYQFGQAIAKVFGLDSSLLVPVSTAVLRQKATRPKNSCLDSSKAKTVTGFSPSGVVEGLRQMRAQEPRRARSA